MKYLATALLLLMSTGAFAQGIDTFWVESDESMFDDSSCPISPTNSDADMCYVRYTGDDTSVGRYIWDEDSGEWVPNFFNDEDEYLVPVTYEFWIGGESQGNIYVGMYDYFDPWSPWSPCGVSCGFPYLPPGG